MKIDTYLVYKKPKTTKKTKSVILSVGFNNCEVASGLEMQTLGLGYKHGAFKEAMPSIRVGRAVYIHTVP